MRALRQAQGRPVVVFLRYWLPVVLWVAVITWMSTEAGSPRRTSRFIGPILRWFNPDVSEQTIQGVQFVVRKTAHLTEYALLSCLVWRARRKGFWGDSRPWRAADVTVAFTLAVLVASTDEWHQSFVPGRDGKVLDVLLDSVGAACGLLGAWLLQRRWEQSGKRKAEGGRAETPHISVGRDSVEP